jgi:zinc transport system ATP-binding protein
MTIASLEKIDLRLGKQTILSQVSLQIKKGQITTLIGPNGGGKTSILYILLGITKPTAGKVVKDSKIKIGYMPQKLEIDKTIPLSAKDFISLSTHKVEFDEQFKRLATRLNVTKILGKQIHDLSGGEMQKILFLRAMMTKPDLLVLDEPTQYMDLSAIQDFYEIIEEIRKNQECAILLVSHDLYAVMQKTDSVFCINRHICCHGSPESVNQHPEYLSLFGERSAVGIYQHHHDHKH